jgi:hypothetical protein
MLQFFFQVGFNVFFCIFCPRSICIALSNMPRALDPMWEYGEPEEGSNRQALTCKLCKTHIKGGVYRLKYHLAKISGYDVGPCGKVTPEIMRAAHDAINAKDKKKEESATKKAELAAFKMYQSSPGISSHATEGSGRGFTAADSLLGKSHLTLLQELDLEHNHQLNQWLKKGSSKRQAG